MEKELVALVVKVLLIVVEFDSRLMLYKLDVRGYRLIRCEEFGSSLSSLIIRCLPVH